jgi:hypothetical protein
LQRPSPQYGGSQSGGHRAADEAARKRTAAGVRRRSLIFKGEREEFMVAPLERSASQEEGRAENDRR